MATINNIKASNEAAFVTAGESVTNRLDDIAKKELKNRSKTLATLAAVAPGYVPVERTMEQLVMSPQGGNGQHSENKLISTSATAVFGKLNHTGISDTTGTSRTAGIISTAGTTESRDKRKLVQTRAVRQPTMPLAYKANSIPLPNILASKDSSGVMFSSKERHSENIKETGVIRAEKNNEVKPDTSPSYEAEKPHEQIYGRENIRPQIANTGLYNAENAVKELTPGKSVSHTRVPTSMLKNTASDEAVNKSPANSRLTYTFSDWGKGHQVNVQMAAHSGTPVVLSPSDSLVQQRLADHSEHHHQGNPEWVFQDDEEKQHSGKQQQSHQDKDQA